MSKLAEYGILRMFPGEIYVGAKERYPTKEQFAQGLANEGDTILGLPNNLLRFIFSGRAKWRLGCNPELDNDPTQGWYELAEHEFKAKGWTPVWFIKVIDQGGSRIVS